jgi:HSP20 family protein
MEVARIQSEINRLFDNLLDLGSDPAGGGGAWMPNVDIAETDETLELRVELPGVLPQTLSLEVHGGHLVVQGEKRPPQHLEGIQRESAERVFGVFRRSIHLGAPVNTRQAAARLQNGLLRLTFPKVPNRRGEPVRIEVEVQE